MTERNELTEALHFIRERTTVSPVLGLILGSGLSALADLVSDAVRLETSLIPGYPTSTVQGHHGRLVLGHIEGKSVVFVQGRLHVYEGLSVTAATFPVRLLGALGVKHLILTNAAGGINPAFNPGTLMWITDHINWTTKNPIAGSGSAIHCRHRRAAKPYDEHWTNQAQAIASNLGIQTASGTYLWTLGPSYETKAEIRAFKLLGADAVGMSTVPEAIEASAQNMKVLGLSTITNFAAGLSDDSLNHEEVLEVGRMVRSKLERLIMAVITSS